MKKTLHLITLLLLTTGIFAQKDSSEKQYIYQDTINRKIIVDIELSNKTKQIRDGMAVARIMGGMPPYEYYWSNQGTAINSNKSTGLTEGQNYSLKVKDANGDSTIVSFFVPTTSIDERINALFVPIVGFMGNVIMADVFALLHIYDPVLRDDSGEIFRHPNGDPMKMKIPFVVVWLILGALFFTVRMGFVNIRGVKHSIDLLRGKYDKPENKGEVSHFQALATALSATVGLGNIAGVAIAITVGGPGATFWMIIAGLLGMSSKFVECTLGVKYRNIDKNGRVSGGPMYYMSKGLKKKNMGRLGKILAVIFSILVIGGSIGGGNMFQANQAFAQLSSLVPALEPYGAYFGIVLAVLVGIVIIGGIKSIAKVTEKIVPFMALLYVGTALVIIIMNITETGHAFGLILEGAFSSNALKGGIIGVLVVGFQRAAFSNEAGVGSASIAHSAVKTDEPITEGLVALLEPFIDTVVICTMTALVIIFTGLYQNPDTLDGVQLTSAAFGSVFSWFPYLLVVAIMLFAFSTMISWSYYGLNGFKYLFSGIIKNKKAVRNTYYVIFLAFVIIGSASSLGAVVDFSDMMILSMGFPNILALVILAPEVKKDLNSFIRRIKTGEIKKSL